MGRFFNERVENRRRTPSRLGLIVGAIIIVIIIFTIAILYNKKQVPKAKKYTLLDSLEVEINSSTPKVEDFFSEIDNISGVSYDKDDIDMTELGSYPVDVYINGKKDKIVVKVVDTTAPDLIVQNVSIEKGASYAIEDFIKECYDNSNDECQYEYVDESYADIKDEGEHYIELYAYDSSNNSTDLVEAQLTIGNAVSKPEDPNSDPVVPGSEECEFGNLDYNTEYYNFPIAIIVGDKETGCAIDMKEWKNPDVYKTADELFNKDKAKLEKDINDYLNTNYPDGAGVYLEHYKRTVLNNTNDGDGLVGYGINVKLYLTSSTITEEDFKANKQSYLVLEYYIKEDGTREYSTNTINLQ